jgi:hypothetical protein
MTNRFITFILFIIFSLAFTLGLWQVNLGNYAGITWAFAPFGIFIWEDGIFLGLFLAAASCFLWNKNKLLCTMLFFSVYAAARSFFEVIYALSAQFSLTSRPWEAGWKSLSIFKGMDVAYVYVAWQLVFTIIFIISVLFVGKYYRLYLKKGCQNEQKTS